MEFDDLENTASGNDYEYDLDDFEAVEWPEQGEVRTVVGELLTTVEGIGQYDSTAYLLNTEADENVMVWGNSSIDAQMENAKENGLTEGDVVGIRQTGETYTNEYGEFKQYAIRFQSQD